MKSMALDSVVPGLVMRAATADDNHVTLAGLTCDGHEKLGVGLGHS
jgi:hypothetical protein